MATDPGTNTGKPTQNSPVLRLGLPKGSLQTATLELLHRAGYNFSTRERSYFPSTDDEELRAMLVRAQEMARYVMDGVFDAGITGKDWVLETQSDVHPVSDLIYSKTSMRPVRWVLAVPENSDIRSVKDLEGKRIATEVVHITRTWLHKNDVNADVEFLMGCDRGKMPRSRGRYRRGYRDGLVTASQQTSHRGCADAFEYTAYRQPGSMGRPVEAAKDRKYCPADARCDPGRRAALDSSSMYSVTV